MQCPHCGLLNPPTALRCDCGWDFTSGTVQTSYLRNGQGSAPHGRNGAARSKLPLSIVAHLCINLALVSFVVYENMRPRPWYSKTSVAVDQGIALILWFFVGAALYMAMLSRKNWARIALAIWTLPSGLLLFAPGARDFTGAFEDVAPEAPLDLKS